MIESFRHIEFKQTVRSTPAELYRAFIHATALRDWLCDAAVTEPRPGGHIFLWWNSGYYMVGEYLKLEPGSLIQMTWHGKDDPQTTQVQISFTPEESSKGAETLVTVRHGHIPVNGGAAWDQIMAEMKEGWSTGLENLPSVIETGIDLRVARRPMLGIFIDEFNPEIAAEIGVPVSEGIRLAGVMDGIGAEKAGLHKNDVIVSFDGKPAYNFALLGEAIRPHQGGDIVPVAFYRGGELKTVSMELSRRSIPEFPATLELLVGQVQKDFDQVNAELAELLKPISEGDASAKPSPKEWSAKENLAHLIACEQDLHPWISDMLNDHPIQDSLEYSCNADPRMAAIVKVFQTLPELLAELKRTQAITVALISNLTPVLTGRKHFYYRICEWMKATPDHYREHFTQMKTAAKSG